jgi:hypothetical protein
MSGDKILKTIADERREDIVEGTMWKRECIGRRVWESIERAIIWGNHDGKESHVGK